MAETNAGDPRIGVTTNERTDTKHLVQPYADTPMVDRQSEQTCAFCGHTGFRRSRVRFTDALQLLMLKYPVRCTRCGQRQRVAVRIALQAQATKLHSPGPSPDRPGSWKSFTASDDVALSHARPATTAAEPVAGRLDDAFRPGPPSRLGTLASAQGEAPTRSSAQQDEQALSQSPTAPAQGTPPAHTPSRHSDDSGIW